MRTFFKLHAFECLGAAKNARLWSSLPMMIPCSLRSIVEHRFDFGPFDYHGSVLRYSVDGFAQLLYQMFEHFGNVLEMIAL
jgi:hypothetical protein